MLILLTVSVACSQGRGNGHGKHGHSNKHNGQWNDNTGIREYYYEGDRYTRRGDHYHYYRNMSPWMKRHHPHMKTRYVYFRDYNVYYDYHRNVYMTLSGRNWVFTAELPLAMHRVEPHRIVYVDVDYFGDDLYAYHSHSNNDDHWPHCCR